MTRRVAAAFVHVTGEDGQTVVLAPGDDIPDDLARFITNPAVITTADGDADTTPSVEPIEGVVEAPLTELSYAALKAAAKARGLSAAGTKEALIERIQERDAQ